MGKFETSSFLLNSCRANFYGLLRFTHHMKAEKISLLSMKELLSLVSGSRDRKAPVMFSGLLFARRVVAKQKIIITF